MSDICIVVPCHNEAARLPGDRLLAFLHAHPSVTFCLVDDGSRDETRRVLERLRAQLPERVIVLGLTPRGGKAAAVRAGVLHAAAAGRWQVLGYWDADLSTPLTEVDRLLTALEADPACQLVLGSRVKRAGAHIERRAVRHVLGRLFATAASLILDLAVYDTQCGAKLFRVEVAGVMFGEAFLTRWLFDLEILARLRSAEGDAALDGVLEVPLGNWREVGGSKLTVADMIRVPMELLRIRSRYHRRAAR